MIAKETQGQPNRTPPRHVADPRKVVIVGSGAVGSTFAFALMRSGLASEIVLVDQNEMRAEGEVMDLNHGMFFSPPVVIRSGNYDDCRGASVVVITAGARQQPGQTRMHLVHENVRICRAIMAEVVRRTRCAVVIVVTNPVDVLTYFAVEFSGLDRRQVIGSGTVLDSARFRYLLSRQYRVDPRNVHAYIVGEHGDSEVALWSMAHIGGVPVEAYRRSLENGHVVLDREEIVQQVRESAYHVIESKGATSYGVSLALERIVSAVLRDENSMLTVSSVVEDVFGVKNVCISLPCVVNRLGVDHVVGIELPEEEQSQLRTSAKVIREVIDRVENELPDRCG